MLIVHIVIYTVRCLLFRDGLTGNGLSCLMLISNIAGNGENLVFEHLYLISGTKFFKGGRL